MLECPWLPFRLAAVRSLTVLEFILIFFVNWTTSCFSTFISFISRALRHNKAVCIPSALSVYKRVTEFAVWCNKLEHHENVDFQRLRGAVSSYHQSRIRLLRHVGLTLLVIAFLARLFSVTECLFFLLFVRKEGRLVGKTLEHIAPLTFTYLFTGDKLKKMRMYNSKFFY